MENTTNKAKENMAGKLVENFKYFLIEEEKSKNTVEKYVRDIKGFLRWLSGKNETIGKICKNTVIEYKTVLVKGYGARSVNSMLASVNCFLEYIGKSQCKVKAVKLQAEVYSPKEKELSKAEYMRLVKASENNERLSLIIQTICATGIRVSELEYITVDAVKRGEATVSCKGKTRKVFMVKALRKKLLEYMKKQNIKKGAVFVTKGGNPINRTNIWREMKNLCKKANVSPEKVYPHNLRHLFARTFYDVEKDIAKLADILGHSSINTTRIYIITTSDQHMRRIEKMRLVI